MKRSLFLATLLLVCTLAIHAQDGTKPAVPYVEVTGKGEMEVVPDQIYLKIVLNEKEMKGKMNLEATEKKMVAKLSEIGVDIRKDLSIRDLASNWKSNWLTGSEALLTKEYQLLVHDTKVLKQVFVEFQKLDISNVTLDRLDHSRMEELRKEVKIQAVKSAKEKAVMLAQAIDQTIGKALYIQEIEYPNLYNAMMGRVAGANVQIRGAVATGQEGAAPDLEFEKLKLQYSVLARFELK
ncbi:MAG: SIMPL domain-containing protein [Marinilabiliales bacterium]|nr:SIMPL domain-containing protein [Marinilabiliales bacterium]